MRHLLAISVSASFLLLAACGGDTEDTVDSDTGIDETDTDMGDTADEDTAPDVDEFVYPAQCTLTDFEEAKGNAIEYTWGTQYVAYSTTDSPYDILLVRVRESLGGPTQPGTYELTGDVPYAERGLVVMALAGCSGSQCERQFLADVGEVEFRAIDGLGGAFDVTLHGVELDEAVIDSDTLEVSYVSEGDVWCVNDVAFEGPVVTQEEANCNDDSVTCIGERTPEYFLTSCASGAEESIDNILQDKATWMVLTAGWCPACRQWIPQVEAARPGVEADGINVIYVLGEDANYEQPTLSYCRQYAAAENLDVSMVYMDHDGTYSFAETFTNLWVYADSSGLFGLPWNAILRTDGTYEYADGTDLDLAETIDAISAE